jgi:glycosyltransferase involved in cell wall biosynthesis
MTRIGIVPTASGVGGMVSFQRRFADRAASLGIEVSYGFDSPIPNAVLIVGGTRHLYPLWNLKKKGVRLVQRLDGLNWLHRRLRTGVRHYLRAEFGNLILRIIRKNFANYIIYQSNFAQRWWENRYGKTGTPSTVIYNGIDLDRYSPNNMSHGEGEKRNIAGGCNKPRDRFRVLMVEGSMAGGYELGIEIAAGLISTLNNDHFSELMKPVELLVVGHVAEHTKKSTLGLEGFDVKWVGVVDHSEIPCLDNSAHLLFSADINAACPNSVIEALACGTPVIGFRTGALEEMVVDGSGIVVPYGGDPWKLDDPDIQGLANGAVKILKNQEEYRVYARKRAVDAFGLGQMVKGYLDILLDRLW